MLRRGLERERKMKKTKEEIEITPLENVIDGYNRQIKELKAENEKLIKEAREIRLACGKDVMRLQKENEKLKNKQSVLYLAVNTSNDLLEKEKAMCEWLAGELWRWSDGEHSKEGWLTQARKEIKKK